METLKNINDKLKSSLVDVIENNILKAVKPNKLMNDSFWIVVCPEINDSHIENLFEIFNYLKKTKLSLF